jgi:WD40 repeat protein
VGPVIAVAALLLPDGTPLAITGNFDGTVRVWNLTTGQTVGHPSPVTRQ